MIQVDEFVYLYHLNESQQIGYYKFIPWERKTRVVGDFPFSFHNCKSRYFFISSSSWETPFDKNWGDVPRLLGR